MSKRWCQNDFKSPDLSSSVSVLYKNLLIKLYKIQIISDLWNLIKLPNRILWS